MQIQHIGKASNADTVHAWKNKQAVPTELLDLVGNNPTIGKDVVAIDVVYEQLEEGNQSVAPLISCTLSARFVDANLPGWPGDYSVWKVTQ